MALAAFVVFGAACGLSAQSSPSTSPVSTSPTPDRAVVAYVDLVHAYHDRYVAARGNGYDYCVVDLDIKGCRASGLAMIAVWKDFLKDLSGVATPTRFTGDVQAIRSQLPKGIDDLEAMVAAAAAGRKTAMLEAANAYIADMVPTVTDALGDIYAPWGTE